MGKYIRNGFAYFRGIFLHVFTIINRNRNIESKVRVFFSSSLDCDRGSKVHIGKGVKIRERTVISVRENGCLEIGENASIGMDCKIAVHEHVVIGAGTLLSPNVMVYDHDHVFDSETGVHRKEFKTNSIIIGKNCWIGANTVILRGTIIGDNCVVGAGTILHGTFPDKSMIIQKRLTDCRIL